MHHELQDPSNETAGKRQSPVLQPGTFTNLHAVPFLDSGFDLRCVGFRHGRRSDLDRLYDRTELLGIHFCIGPAEGQR